MARDKVVLAYSGGLDTSVAVKWINETYNLDVIAYTCDLGQGQDIDAIREKALRTGAVAALTVPRDALVLREAHTYVMRVKADNTAERVEVRAGAARDALVEVTGELSPGDRVVADAGLQAAGAAAWAGRRPARPAGG